MNAQDSRLTCEHCHGTGYITTALGKLPCLTCNTSEFVSIGQDQSEVTKRENRPKTAGQRSTLVKQAGAIRKNSTDLACCSFLGFGFGVSRDGDRPVVEVLTVFANGKSRGPFTDVNTQINLLRLDGHTKFFIGLWTGPVGRRLQKKLRQIEKIGILDANEVLFYSVFPRWIRRSSTTHQPSQKRGRFSPPRPTSQAKCCTRLSPKSRANLGHYPPVGKRCGSYLRSE